MKSEIQIEAVDKMELYEAIYKRRTVRKFLEKEVDFDAVKRVSSSETAVLNKIPFFAPSPFPTIIATGVTSY